MDSDRVQQLCEQGQSELMRMEYLRAAKTLSEAEAMAWRARDFDALSRLYMPLQEARRQRRQRCAEGMIRLDFIARDPSDVISPQRVLDEVPAGTVLVAGWKSLEPAIETRRLADKLGRYVDVFLASANGDGRMFIFPDVVNANPADIPATAKGVMELWERLHFPFLKSAEAQSNPLEKIEIFRMAIHVDYGCELAHQHLADAARAVLQSGKRSD
jgi:hypothetical protein